MEHFYQNIQGWFTYPNLYSSMVNKFPTNSHFVEVGVWKGTSAAYMAVEILNSNKSIRFDCVDTWLGSEEHLDPNSSAYERGFETNPDYLWETYLKNIQPVQDSINSIRLPSIEASKLYENNSLDFVFIDGAHDFQNVLLDIQHWLPKVKVGGVLAGHDYSWSGEVQRAVHTVFRTIDEETEGCWVATKT
jgi:hypothetical protein